jgi:hypothetical protein
MFNTLSSKMVQIAAYETLLNTLAAVRKRQKFSVRIVKT